MKFHKLIIACFILVSIKTFSQDTIKKFNHYRSGYTYYVVAKGDTNIICTNSSNKVVSMRPIKNSQINGTVKQWYDNGKLMWEKEYKNNYANGKGVFYNSKGKQVAELELLNDSVIKETSIKKDITIIIGKLRYHSIVYGGVENEDGSSNVQESSGNKSHFKMYAAKVHEKKKPELIQNFMSDDNGNFMVIVPSNSRIGFFPETQPFNSLKPGVFAPDENAGMSGHGGWNYKNAIETENKKVIQVTFTYSSVGYAP